MSFTFEAPSLRSCGITSRICVFEPQGKAVLGRVLGLISIIFWQRRKVGEQLTGEHTIVDK